MNILLDTCVFLWYVTADPKMPSHFLPFLLNKENRLYLSAASSWEISLKWGKKTYPVPPDETPADFVARNRLVHEIISLPVSEEAALFVAQLSPHHNDPFDRLLVAQSIKHNLVFASEDQHIVKYSVKLLPKP